MQKSINNQPILEGYLLTERGYDLPVHIMFGTEKNRFADVKKVTSFFKSVGYAKDISLKDGIYIQKKNYSEDDEFKLSDACWQLKVGKFVFEEPAGEPADFNKVVSAIKRLAI